MLIDDSLTNLRIGKATLSDKYDVFTVPSAEKMLNLLESNVPDMILLDINMPGMDGYKAIKILKARPETRDIPVIFLTAQSDNCSELEGLNLGAIDYITKPFSPSLLQKRIEVHLLVESQKRELQNYNRNLQQMVAEKTKTVVRLQNKILKTVAELVEFRDDTAEPYVERTQRCLGIMATAILKRGLYMKQAKDWDIDLLLHSSQLHDVGKISVRDSILRKPGRLTDEEFDEMKKHTSFGVSIIEKIEDNDREDDHFLTYAKIFAGLHHERWDGAGYPDGLRGEEIPLLGRLMAIADVYDALTSERPYKKPFSHRDAVSIIADGKGTHFDPLLTDLFIEIADELDRPEE
ncbi:MAG: response regulator [Synergistaceae bacterium]|nr:response regulator [Synergistaceae bacterium]